jgi:putative nucleotidyltransferase with HDIG domain
MQNIGLKRKKRKIPLTIDNLVAKAGISELASIGSVVNRIVQVIRNPNSSASELKDIIEIDPPLSAKVLRRANSAYYGVKRNIVSIQEAVVFMGFRALKELALNLKIGKVFEKDTLMGEYSRKKLWKHSLALALCCKNIYRKEFREQGEDIYSAALLHDIGIMVEEEFAPDEFKMVIEKIDSGGMGTCEAEKEVLGFDHAQIGQALTRKWQLPEELTNAIGYHHRPLRANPDFAKQAHTVYVSDYICKEYGIGLFGYHAKDSDTYEKCLESLNISAENLEIIMEDVIEELEEMERNGELYP